MKKLIFSPLFLVVFFFISCNSDDDSSAKPSTCEDVAAIISDQEFEGIDTSTYEIIAVRMAEDCLEIEIADSGCNPDNWDLNLLSVNSFFTVHPMERAVKVEMINDELCAAAFEKTTTFDLTPFQIEGQNEITLHIEGWDTEIVYRY